MPQQPTVYVCAQARDDQPRNAGTSEPLFVLINAPATGDHHRFESSEISQCARQTFDLLQRCGLSVTWHTWLEQGRESTSRLPSSSRAGSISSW